MQEKEKYTRFITGWNEGATLICASGPASYGEDIPRFSMKCGENLQIKTRFWIELKECGKKEE